MGFSCFCLGGGGAARQRDGRTAEEAEEAARKAPEAPGTSLYQAALQGDVGAIRAHLAAGSSPETHSNELNYTP